MRVLTGEQGLWGHAQAIADLNWGASALRAGRSWGLCRNRHLSSTCKVRGRTANQVNRLIAHFCALEANLSTSNYSGAAYPPQRRHRTAVSLTLKYRALVPRVNPRSSHGVPIVVEQRPEILCNCLYLLSSLKDSPGLGAAEETNRRGGEANPVHGRNTTVNVDKTRHFRPPQVWTKTFVFPTA